MAWKFADGTTKSYSNYQLPIQTSTVVVPRTSKRSSIATGTGRNETRWGQCAAFSGRAWDYLWASSVYPPVGAPRVLSARERGLELGYTNAHIFWRVKRSEQEYFSQPGSPPLNPSAYLLIMISPSCLALQCLINNRDAVTIDSPWLKYIRYIRPFISLFLFFYWPII